MSKNSGIYKITNMKNSKCYIGSSINLKSRKYNHFLHLRNNTHTNPYLQKSFNKNGENNFKWEVLEYIDRDSDDKEFKKRLISREQYYLDLYESWNSSRGYNICSIADSRLGSKHSNESKKKMSEKAKNLSKEIILKRAKSRLGFKHTEEARKKMSRNTSGENHPFYNKNLSEEHKAKISNSSKDKTLTQQTKDKIRNYRIGKTHTEETKLKIGLANKGRKPINININYKKVINLDTGLAFNSVKEASVYYNIKSPTRICRTCKGIEKQAGGYRWGYYK